MEQILNSEKTVSEAELTMFVETWQKLGGRKEMMLDGSFLEEPATSSYVLVAEQMPRLVRLCGNDRQAQNALDKIAELVANVMHYSQDYRDMDIMLNRLEHACSDANIGY